MDFYFPGILYNEEIGWSDATTEPRIDISKVLGLLPSYKGILTMLGY